MHDWQFWVATAVAAAALLWMLRSVLPIPWLKRRRARRRGTTRATLTIGGKPVERDGG